MRIPPEIFLYNLKIEITGEVQLCKEIKSRYVGVEFRFEAPVGSCESHLAFDDRHRRVADADFVGGVDGGATSDGGGVI